MTFNLRTTLVTTLLIITLNSCSTSISRNELQNLPSLIDITGIDLTDGQLKIRVSHRNNKTRLNSKLSCQLALKDHKPIKFKQLPLPDLTNYAVETIDYTFPEDEIPSMAQSNSKLPYVLDCYLFSDNFREEHLIKKATLYKVPGSQGKFR